ncbi:nuclear pore complex protein Nup98-Nup96-like isoform 1 [Corchorus olitorius]|uniref:Nuclear pore complex protein Nup98-Nup96-like isoform 1 n=1 Tax=Corchorus olitorius TaxID=93759 RepID=A0A1R3JV54_9ROSI|nr:nuclear pore complex protein Nup98-Nup96-like isoform 1 [Corchorus olitorius]
MDSGSDHIRGNPVRLDGEYGGLFAHLYRHSVTEESIRVHHGMLKLFLPLHQSLQSLVSFSSIPDFLAMAPSIKSFVSSLLLQLIRRKETFQELQGGGTGANMSDDEDGLQINFSLDKSGADCCDLMGFCPLLPTESERSFMERFPICDIEMGFQVAFVIEVAEFWLAVFYCLLQGVQTSDILLSFCSLNRPLFEFFFYSIIGPAYGSTGTLYFVCLRPYSLVRKVLLDNQAHLLLGLQLLLLVSSSATAFGASLLPLHLALVPVQHLASHHKHLVTVLLDLFDLEHRVLLSLQPVTIGGHRGGSRVAPYMPTIEADSGSGTQLAAKLESMSAMPDYKDESHEKLRWEDYQFGWTAANCLAFWRDGLCTSSTLAFEIGSSALNSCVNPLFSTSASIFGSGATPARRQQLQLFSGRHPTSVLCTLPYKDFSRY